MKLYLSIFFMDRFMSYTKNIFALDQDRVTAIYHLLFIWRKSRLILK